MQAQRKGRYSPFAFSFCTWKNSCLGKCAADIVLIAFVDLWLISEVATSRQIEEMASFPIDLEEEVVKQKMLDGLKSLRSLR